MLRSLERDSAWVTLGKDRYDRLRAASWWIFRGETTGGAGDTDTGPEMGNGLALRISTPFTEDADVKSGDTLLD